MSPQQWYYRLGGQEYGPVSAQVLRQLAEEDRLRPDSQVRLAENAAWVPASKVRGLFVLTKTGSASPAESSKDGASSSGKQWQVSIKGEFRGPISTAELKRMAASGVVSPDDLVRQFGSEKWYPARRYTGLFDQLDKSKLPPTLSKSDSSAPSSTSSPGRTPSPAGEDQVRFRCFHCNSRLRTKVSVGGKRIKCPTCQKMLIVPLKEMAPHSGSDQVSVIHSPRNPSIIDGLIRDWDSLVYGPNRAASDLRPPRDRIEFYGPNRKVDLGRGALDSPLIYATGSYTTSCREASLVELPLAIAASDVVATYLPYWPTYHDASPAQRRNYLDWLYGGRCDPNAELGYVFIYLYGLETRVVVDQCDHDVVIREVLRLLPIYRHSRSFCNYAGALLWMAAACLARSGTIDANLIHQMIDATDHWVPSTRLHMKAVAAEVGWQCFPAEFQSEVLIGEEGLPNSVIAKRHSERMRTLFVKRLADEPAGSMSPLVTPAAGPIEYRTASPTLPPLSLARLNQYRWSVIHFSRKQTKRAVQLWMECLEELREFDRAARGVVGDQLTAEMYEALPVDLRVGDHPEWSAWEELLQGHSSDDGWTAVPVSHFAVIKGIPFRDRLTKGQCEQILATATALGLGIEPDPRRGDKSYKWDQRVVLFPEASDDIAEKDWLAYRSATAILELGMQIAAADDDVTDDELSRITQHLERSFSLPIPLQKRLEARLYLHRQHGLSDRSMVEVIRQRLRRKERERVADFLIDVALADSEISKKEELRLRKICQDLAIPESYLNKVLEAATTKEAPVSEDVEVSNDEDGDELVAVNAEAPMIDVERLRRIREETRRVQLVLVEALQDDEVLAIDGSDESDEIEDCDSTAELSGEPILDELSTVNSTKLWAGMPEQYHAACSDLCDRDCWTRSDVQQLARRHGLMASALLDAINEWSQDRFGDWLAEESDDSVIIHQQLIRNVS